MVVNWNGRDFLANFLRSLEATRGEISYGVYVVDNASSDGSAHMVRMEFPTVHLIENRENLGFSRANNLAIEQSHSRYVMLLNNDTLVFPDTLEHMVHFMDAHPRVGIAGWKLLNPDGSWQPSSSRFPTPCNLVFGKLRTLLRCASTPGDPASPAPQSVDVVTGACMIVRREAIAKVGPMDGNIFLYLEDDDWCYRMKQGGWQVMFVPSAQTIHFLGGSLRTVKTSVFRKKYEYCRNQIYFYHKHYPKAYLVLYRLLRAGWFVPVYGMLAWRGMIERRSEQGEDRRWVGKILRELIWTTEGMRTFGKSQYWTS